MIAYWLGRSSGRRAAYRGRGGIGCGFVVAWLLLIGAAIVWWKIAVPVIVGLVVAMLVAAGYVSARRRSGAS